MKKLFYINSFILLLTIGVSNAYAQKVFSGIIKPIHNIELSMEPEGIIKKIYKQEGEKVKKGEKLIQIDSSLQHLEVQRREETLNDLSQIEANEKKLKIIEELYLDAKKLEENSRSISKEEVKTLQIQYTDLKGEIDTLKSMKKREQIEYNIAKEVFEKYTLYSPINGTIAVIKNDEGEWLKNGEKLIQIIDKSICFLEINIENRYLLDLKKGMKKDIFVKHNGKEIKIKGTISYISPIADLASGLTRIKIEFINKNGIIRPGINGFVKFKNNYDLDASSDL